MFNVEVSDQLHLFIQYLYIPMSRDPLEPSLVLIGQLPLDVNTIRKIEYLDLSYEMPDPSAYRLMLRIFGDIVITILRVGKLGDESMAHPALYRETQDFR
jgi:hypothetical protein